MPEPVFVALLLADRVITEDNQKKGIIGTFNQFSLRQLPALLPPWFIYAAVTNLGGDHTFTVNLVVDRSQQVLFSAGGKVTVDSPRRVIELVIPVANVPFVEPGTHTVCFFIDGAQIGSRVLEVMRVEEKPGPERSS
jgi:hypothetical protein